MRQDPWAPERRRAERQMVPFELHAHVEGDPARLLVREFGRGGMVVESDQPMRAGRGLRLTVVSSTAAVGPITGRVVHSRLILPIRHGERRACLAGVTFDAISRDVAAGIEALLLTVDVAPATEPRQDLP